MHSKGVRSSALAFAAMLIAGLAIASSAFASTKGVIVNFSPPSVNGGTSVAITVSFNDTSQTQMVGSAQLTAPSGFRVTSTTNGKIDSTGTVVTLGGLGIQAGGSGAIGLTVSTPACGSPTGTWGAIVHQSNNFNDSSPNHSANLVPNDQSSSLTTAINPCPPPAATTLQFGTQPQTGIQGQNITGTAYNPSGPPVTVKVVDQYGHAFAGAIVTMGIGSNPSGATLGGVLTETSDSTGTASFPSLNLSKQGVGYTLLAGSSGASSATSGSFDQSSSGKFCNNNDVNTGTCTTTATSSNNNSSTVTASYTADGNAGTLSLNVNIGPPLNCSAALYGGYQTISPDTWGFAMDPSTNRSESWTVTLRNPLVPLTNTLSLLLNNPQVCYGSLIAFPVASGGINGFSAPATLPSGQSGFMGTLRNCPQVNAPCIDQQHVNRSILDSNNPLGVDLIVPVNVPPGQGDPYRN